MLIKLELMTRCCNCESAPRYMMQFLNMINVSASVKHAYLSNFVMQVTKNAQIQPQRYSKGMVNMLTLIKTFFIRMPNTDFVNNARLILLATGQLIAEQNQIVTDELHILYTEIECLKTQLQDNPNNVNEEFVDVDDERAPPNDFLRNVSSSLN